MSRLLSLNVGLPRDIPWQGRTVYTGIWKDPVAGRRMVRRLNIDGDGQGDLGGHGGEHRAVFVYQIESYRYWEKELGRHDFAFGQFGENFTIEGLADNEVCIGDRYRIGGALFEVTQPRVTCYRVGLRMNDPRMPSLLVSHHRPGFYFRVLEEGEVGSGDDIIKVAAGPQAMTVAETDALLYLPDAAEEKVQRALTIPALSPGWQGSFRAILEDRHSGASRKGAAGLAAAPEPPPAWTGFRRMRVSQTKHESGTVMSLVLEPGDGRPLSPALPGQFVVLRMQPTPEGPPLLRSYSLSDTPSADHYRISVKREEHGVGSEYVHTHVKQGDVLDVSAPRGSFTLRPGDGPVVLLSAGVGATPVLAMLHALAAESSKREIWWLYGARNSEDHPFRQEAHDLLQKLKVAHTHVCYSRPAPEDKVGTGFDTLGRISSAVIEELGVPLDADFYLCGPTAFMKDLTDGIVKLGVAASRVHAETFGPGESITPGVVGTSAAVVPHPPKGAAGSGPQVSFARSGVAVPWDTKFQSILELAEACDVPVRWSCRMGVCHTCESGIVSGAVEYQPDPLQPPAEGNVLICCCQPKGDVVLDL